MNIVDDLIPGTRALLNISTHNEEDEDLPNCDVIELAGATLEKPITGTLLLGCYVIIVINAIYD